MASSTGSGSPSLDTINNLFGTSLEFPKCFRKPGTASLFEAKTGSGHLGTRGAALEANPGITAPITFDSLGINFHKGLYNISGALTVEGSTTFIGGFYGRTAAWVLDSDSYSISSSGNISLLSGPKMKLVAEEELSIVAGQTINIAASAVNVEGLGELITVVNSKKGFDIPHPNKKNYRLRHICVEGPESAVYIRGKLTEKNIINLPDYWSGLVDMNTISVQLTQIGYSQDLIVDEINNNQIKIKSGNGASINCYYQVWVDRLGEKLIVEYVGKTPKDYPGDNDEYSLAGWNYDKRSKK